MNRYNLQKEIVSIYKQVLEKYKEQLREDEAKLIYTLKEYAIAEIRKPIDPKYEEKVRKFYNIEKDYFEKYVQIHNQKEKIPLKIIYNATTGAFYRTSLTPKNQEKIIKIPSTDIYRILEDEDTYNKLKEQIEKEIIEEFKNTDTIIVVDASPHIAPRALHAIATQVQQHNKKLGYDEEVSLINTQYSPYKELIYENTDISKIEQYLYNIPTTFQNWTTPINIMVVNPKIQYKINHLTPTQLYERIKYKINILSDKTGTQKTIILYNACFFEENYSEIDDHLLKIKFNEKKKKIEFYI